jgi:MFS family permease
MMKQKKAVGASILVAALGYFVDIYDLILFSVVRIKSLKAIGIAESELLGQGVFLLNMQMAGMLLGGILWGILGDKKGRLSVLFGSIFLYSAANIANAFVDSVPAYAALRFIAGIGLAGELGAGITLVSEVMSKEMRGYGTMIVATIGILGAVVAALIGDMFDWRVAYFVGGVLGFLLFFLRIGVFESGLFAEIKTKNVRRGSFFTIFQSFESTIKYLCCILIGAPIWFVIGILITFSPEIGLALRMPQVPNPGKAVMFAYLGLALGDFISGTLAQFLKSRKKIAKCFIILTGIFIATYLTNAHADLNVFYANCLGLGFAIGYWAVFVTIASEQFGTNVRATVTTTAPNFVRGSVIPLTFAFQGLKPYLDVIGSAAVVATATLVVAFVSISYLDETYGKDLNYVE